MRATELIGKRAIRTKPIIRERVVGGYISGGTVYNEKDYSYTDSPSKIVNATDTHIVAMRKGIGDNKEFRVILDCRFCDNNWIDFDELVGEAEEK